jgi:hypothetical protein
VTQRSIAVPQVPVSWGELIDKITILEIKNKKIRAEEKLANIRRELALLERIAEPVLSANEFVAEMKSRLRAVNESLWNVEDRIREKEAEEDFGPEFVALARSVYTNNDERAALKRKINEAMPCGIAEEKSYAGTSASDG